MNEQLQDALADVLESLVSGARAVGNAAGEQLPLVVEEYLKWGIVRASFGFGVTVLIAAVVFIALRRLRLYKVGNCIADFCDGSECKHMKISYLFGGIVLPILAAIALSFPFFEFGGTVLQIMTAPRVYLIERAADMVKPRGK